MKATRLPVLLAILLAGALGQTAGRADARRVTVWFYGEGDTATHEWWHGEEYGGLETAVREVPGWTVLDSEGFATFAGRTHLKPKDLSSSRKPALTRALAPCDAILVAQAHATGSGGGRKLVCEAQLIDSKTRKVLWHGSATNKLPPKPAAAQLESARAKVWGPIFRSLTASLKAGDL